MTSTDAPERPALRSAAGISFLDMMRAEWTKFRSVRGWVIGMILAAILTVVVGVFTANASLNCVINGVPKAGKACEPYIPLGPGGEAVQDSFYFVHKTLSGNGTVTARITSLTGRHVTGNGQGSPGQAPPTKPGLMPWSKAGVMIKESTKQGSQYAAMLATGGHGIRMQWNFTGDAAGLPGTVTAASPRWLRLVRSGDTITGYDSIGGTHWTRVGTVTLTALPRVVQVGLFATSPAYTQTSSSFGGSSSQVGPSQATGVFDHVSVLGGSASGSWTGTSVGGSHLLGPAVGNNGGPLERPGTHLPGHGSAQRFHRPGGVFSLTGSGDIAPLVPGPGSEYPTVTIEQSLTGIFIGLIAVAVVAAMFFTAEYRRGLIRTTFAAMPPRGRLLAAKAVVIGAVAFVTGLVASIAAIMLGVPREENEGPFLLPTTVLTDIRVVVGTAALVAVVAVLALGLGAALRRSAAAITTAIVVVVLPFLLSALNVFPSGVADWVMRLTPAAGFAIQQSIPNYPQVTSVISVARGVYPLSPWAGFAVLCCWAAAALGLGVVMLSRRDA